MRYALDNTRRGRCDLPKRVDVRHDIMAPFLLFLCCDLKLFHIQMLNRAYNSASIVKMSSVKRESGQCAQDWLSSARSPRRRWAGRAPSLRWRG